MVLVETTLNIVETRKEGARCGLLEVCDGIQKRNSRLPRMVFIWALVSAEGWTSDGPLQALLFAPNHDLQAL